jgi:hypothetical protein
MRTKLVIVFLFLLPIIDLFYSCCDCDVTAEKVSYSHKTLLLKNLNNNAEYPIETETVRLNKSAYGIRLYLTREQNATACTKPVNSIFIQSAYAFSCECPPERIYTASDSIVSIKIFTINNFDDNHSENSDVTDCFKIRHSYSSIEDYVANERYTYEDYFKTPLTIDLLLMNVPTADNNQQFKVQVVLSDKRIFEQLTNEIQLL